MSLHVAGFFAAKWSQDIEREWVTNLLKNRTDLDAGRLAATCHQMHRVVPDWEVTNYEPLISALQLPDEQDRHVLAAAIRGHADCIVTFNLQDFPRDRLAPFEVEAIHPDDFLALQLDLHPVDALKAFKAMRGRLRRPPMSPGDFLACLARTGLGRTASLLAEDIELL